MQFENATMEAPASEELNLQKPTEEMFANNSGYKQKLRAMPEVQNITNEIDVNDVNSILKFGQKPSEEISALSDELLKNMKSVKTAEATEMMTQLTKIMDKFDVKELEDPEKAQGFFSKMMGKLEKQLEKMFEKYDNMGKEVDKVYVILKQYEADINRSNTDLDRMYNANKKFFGELEKYIVAGEIGLEEIDAYKEQIKVSNANENDIQMQLQKLDMVRDMLAQRIYDLQIAENVAMQTCPMIVTIQQSNFNLSRKINSSFIITLPIFKQCLIQAVNLKRQQIQAKSISELDAKTNELLQRNAKNTATQSVAIAKMAGGSSIKIETLQETYETIKNGIEETRKINEEIAAERGRNSQTLENMKSEMKSKGIA